MKKFWYVAYALAASYAVASLLTDTSDAQANRCNNKDYYADHLAKCDSYWESHPKPTVIQKSHAKPLHRVLAERRARQHQRVLAERKAQLFSQFMYERAIMRQAQAYAVSAYDVPCPGIVNGSYFRDPDFRITMELRRNNNGNPCGFGGGGAFGDN